MAGRGPAPKRSDQRRRRNLPGGGLPSKAPGAAEVRVPKPNSKWHPVASRWFLSLAESGQSVFYEPSDWALAEVLAESMSRDLRPQPVGINEATGESIMVEFPLRGASMASYLKAMTQLLVTESDRRRAGIELERPRPNRDETKADVSKLDEYRKRSQPS